MKKVWVHQFSEQGEDGPVNELLPHEIENGRKKDGWLHANAFL